MRNQILLLTALLVGCSSAKSESGTSGTTDTGAAETVDYSSFPESSGPEIPDAAICDEDRAFCGTLVAPESFTGTPRSLAIALYASIPPAGPPDAILAEIEAPSIGAGERYPVRIQPMLETGDYFVWANLYMEGGGEWVPVNGIDYTGASDGALTLDGTVGTFEPIVLSLAEGW